MARTNQRSPIIPLAYAIRSSPQWNEVFGTDSVEFILDDLSRAFPDFTIIPAEILQDGNKVVVRSELTGTQRAQFMGFPAKNRRMAIQTSDIHEFKAGKIVRTWHSEDWLTARCPIHCWGCPCRKSVPDIVVVQ
jgi:hypothetical protein